MSKREAIIAGLRTLPPLPAAVQQTLLLLRDPDTELKTLATALQLDPWLTASVLRLANASVFAGRNPCSTVHDALVRLGANRVGELVLATGVGPRLSTASKGYDLPAGALLEHSLSTALAAVELAGKLRIAAPQYTFTAGLLANIGKTVLGHYLEVDANPILELALAEMIPFHEAEQRVLGIDHAETGALLLEQWNLPQVIVEVVRWYLTPDDYPGQNVVLDLVHIADMLAKLCSVALGVDGLIYRPSTFVVQRLELTPEIVEQVVADVSDQAAELRSALVPEG